MNIKTIKLLLIMPNANIHRQKIGSMYISFREAPLTLTTLAALIPDDIAVDVTLIDESIQKIDSTKNYDLVAISCMTGTSTRAYEIADQFKKKGSKIVLGGIHVTLQPKEAKKHADTIVIGFAEETWPKLLKDFVDGKIQSVYQSNNNNIDNLPIPARSLQHKFGYLTPNTVFATRGCKNSCSFCSVPAAKFGWQTRPVGQVIDEIKKIKTKRFVFNDVSLLEDREYAKELFSALIPLRKKWGGLCTTRIGDDDEMLDLIAKSGCIYLLIGFESVSKLALTEIKKGFNKIDAYHLLLNKLHSKNIIVQGCFIFGFDTDTREIFDETVEAVNKLKIDIPRYALYTPYPGTAAFTKLNTEKRILHTHWHHYDTQHVVFQPKQMTPDELDIGFRKAWTKTFNTKSIYQRTFRPNKNALISMVGNIAYRKYIKRLNSETERILTKN